MKRKAEQFLSPLNPKSVVWDFDETLAAIRPAAIFLKTIQHALTEDPFAKKLLPEVKLSLLQDVASTIVQKGIFRPGMNKFFQLLERLKRMGFVKNVYIFTAASPPKEKSLFYQLHTSLQRLLLEAMLSSDTKIREPTKLIKAYHFSNHQPKNLKKIPDQHLYIVDDVSIHTNYMNLCEKLSVDGFEICPFFRSDVSEEEATKELEECWGSFINKVVLHEKSVKLYYNRLKKQYLCQHKKDCQRAKMIFGTLKEEAITMKSLENDLLQKVCN